MNLSELSDEEIIEKLRDCALAENSISNEYRVIFKVLYERYDKRAYHLCRHYGLNTDDSDDVVQEAYIKLYKYIKSFKKGNLLGPWFFRIIFNELKDRCNYNKRHSYDDISDMKDTLSNKEENISEELQNKDYVKGITSRLPEKLRKVLTLKIYGCMNFEEIGRVLTISPNTAKSRLKKAFDLVRSNLEKDNERK